MNLKAIESQILELFENEKINDETNETPLTTEEHCRSIFEQKEDSENEISTDPSVKKTNNQFVVAENNDFLSDPKVYRLTIIDLDALYATEEALRAHCGQFGPIHHVSIENNSTMNTQKYIGIADFYRLADAVCAKDRLLKMQNWKIFFSAEQKKDLRTLYVSNFPKHFNHNDLKRFLEKWGKIRSVRVFGLGQPTMVAFVTCENIFEAKQILHQTNGIKFEDSKKVLRVRYANLNSKKKSINVHGISGDFCSPPQRTDLVDIENESSSEQRTTDKPYYKQIKKGSVNKKYPFTLKKSHSFEQINLLGQLGTRGKEVHSVNSNSSTISSTSGSTATAQSSTNQYENDQLEALEKEGFKDMFNGSDNLPQLNLESLEKHQLVDSLLSSSILKGINSSYISLKSTDAIVGDENEVKKQKGVINLFLAVTINGVPALIPANYAVSMKIIPEAMLKKKGWIAKPIILNRKYDDYNLKLKNTQSSFSLYNVKDESD